jgi:menaquinone-dependent protoporphyrinogen IX oxidase
MRIAVLSVPKSRQTEQAWARSLAAGMRAKGHQVDILDAWTEDSRKLALYQYIAVAVEQVSFFGVRMPEALSRFLGSASFLSGRKCAAFLKKRSPFVGKAMSALMRSLEKEGMIVNWSDVITSTSQAELLGKQIGS